MDDIERAIADRLNQRKELAAEMRKLAELHESNKSPYIAKSPWQAEELLLNSVIRRCQRLLESRKR